MKKLVVLTGAGISAESGIKTFRDSDGLWEGFKIEDVATPEAWNRDPKMVQTFYNERRKRVLAAQPNEAHFQLADLEKYFEVSIITQNVDDLHERAGSTNVIHLHGVITYARSSVNPTLIYPIIGDEIKEGELCELGSPLRPHIVWFGEEVPMIEVAASLCTQADYFMVVGTSLMVYPAAGLIDFVPRTSPKYIVDKKIPYVRQTSLLHTFETNASVGVKEVAQLLKDLI